MRVITGTYGGRNLKTLKGDNTRPTTMRVKESLFSSLISLVGSFEGMIVLDAFAGSGALGIEALSRGAAKAVFFERSRKAAAIVAENIRTLGIERDRATIEQGDAERLVTRARPDAFDLVFFDPPYAMEPEAVLSLAEALLQANALNADALICYELAKKNKPALELSTHRLKWNIVSTKDFGETAYYILRKEN